MTEKDKKKTSPSTLLESVENIAESVRIMNQFGPNAKRLLDTIQPSWLPAMSDMLKSSESLSATLGILTAQQDALWQRMEAVTEPARRVLEQMRAVEEANRQIIAAVNSPLFISGPREPTVDRLVRDIPDRANTTIRAQQAYIDALEKELLKERQKNKELLRELEEIKKKTGSWYIE